MAVTDNYGDGIITLGATDSIDRDQMAVESIIVTGTAAGAFALILGNSSITVSTGAADLTKQIFINRKLNSITLSSGPTGAALYVMLQKKA